MQAGKLRGKKSAKRREGEGGNNKWKYFIA